MLRDKSGYYERRYGEGYDAGIIIGRTEYWVSAYRQVIKNKKRACQLKCETESDEHEKKEILADIENSFEHISFKDDMDRFLKKYPRRSDSQLARKICAESEYRYVINKWIKFRRFKEEEPDFYGVDE